MLNKALVVSLKRERLGDELMAKIRLYALKWGERFRILGGDRRLGQVTPPAWSNTRNR